MCKARIFGKRLLRFGSTSLVLLTSFCVLRGAPGISAGKQVLHGRAPAGASKWKTVGRLPGTNHLNLAIALPLRNKAELNQLLQQLYDPSSPQYHQFLTVEQFTERFGPTAEDYQALIAFATANGLTVTATYPNRTLLDVNGAVADIERALHVTMRVYQHPTESRLFYALDADPSLDLDIPVLDIRGLDNYCVPRPAFRRTDLDKVHENPFEVGSGPQGTYLGKDFRVAYAPGVQLDGSGQIVGLFELDGYNTNDIISYEKLGGLPNVTLTNVLIDGFKGKPVDPNAVVEVCLDIEMAVAMAPGLSSVMVYEAPLNAAAPYDILNRMVTDNRAKQISSSWVITEIVNTPIPDQIYQELGAQGQSFFQASGDEGAFYPAIFQWSDNPYTTIVGGTTLSMSGKGGSYTSETTWTPFSGGGISLTNFGNYPLPVYQQGIDMTVNMGSTTNRNIPDVALTADNIWVIADNGQSFAVGGTSAAAPLWAGFTALINQQATANTQPLAGFLNPALYALGKGPNFTTVFNDITTGNNTNSGSPNLYYACPGYDLCTGWGTPKGSNLINVLAPLGLQILPAAGFTAIGPNGGPFSTNSQSYALTNAGATAISWGLINTSAWLSASSTNGTLQAGGTGSVTVSLNAAASNLVSGTYSGSVRFTNLTSGGYQVRQFTLITHPVPPFITAQPQSQTLLPGTNAIFSVTAQGSLPLGYQWQKNATNLSNGGNISGATNSILRVNGISLSDGGNYSVIVSNGVGITPSSNALLTLAVPPVITTQPQSQTVAEGQGATFTVTAAGPPTLAYQWRVGGNAIAGATAPSFTIASVQITNEGQYSVVVSNGYGSTASSNAVLGVVDLLAVGDNSEGQIIVPPTLTDVIAIAAGDYHSLALRTNGSVFAWGGDVDGQCDVPTNLIPALAIAAGGYHSLAIQADGSVLAWGNDDYGQSTLPPGLSNVIAVAAGTWHSFALRADGRLFAWGDNSFGQTNLPAGLSNVVAIAAGGGHNLALRADGSIAAWGENTDSAGDYAGQCDVPANVTNAVAIGAGDFHSLAVLADGSVVAWGDNSQGQCTIPSGLAGAVEVAGGGADSFALGSNGTVTAWGVNSSGQGNIPVSISNAVAVAAGESHTVVLLSGSPPVAKMLLPAWNGSRFSALFQTLYRKNYALEFKNTLAASNWTALPTVAGNGALRLLIDPAATGAQRFYRVQQW
jgi:hypothetical protein